MKYKCSELPLRILDLLHRQTGEQTCYVLDEAGVKTVTTPRINKWLVVPDQILYHVYRQYPIVWISRE